MLTKRIEGDTWETMVRPGKRLKPGDSVDFADGFRAHIDANGEGGTRIVTFEYDGIFMERLEEIGSMPLPPYIERAAEDGDKSRYLGKRVTKAVENINTTINDVIKGIDA